MSKNITTPIGTAVLPFLQEEDKTYGGYKVRLRVDKQTAEDFKRNLIAHLDGHAFKTKNVKFPISPDSRMEGMYLISASSNYKPVVFDSKKRPISSNQRIGGGSELRIIAQVYPWEVKKEEGVKLRLQQAQIFKLASNDDCGFDEIEDGFEVENSDETTQSLSEETNYNL